MLSDLYTDVSSLDWGTQQKQQETRYSKHSPYIPWGKWRISWLSPQQKDASSQSSLKNRATNSPAIWLCLNLYNLAQHTHKPLTVAVDFTDPRGVGWWPKPPRKKLWNSNEQRLTHLKQTALKNQIWNNNNKKMKARYGGSHCNPRYSGIGDWGIFINLRAPWATYSDLV